MMMEKNAGYVGFEYMEVPANSRMESLYVDSYRNFGWEYEGNAGGETKSGNVLMKFKRDRKSATRRSFPDCKGSLRPALMKLRLWKNRKQPWHPL